MKYFLGAVSGFIIAIIIFSQSLSFYFIFSSFFLFILIFLYTKIFEESQTRFLGFLIAIFFLGFFLGGLRVFVFEKNISNELNIFKDHRVEFKGIVLKETENNSSIQKVLVKITEVKVDDAFVKKDGKVLIITNLYPKFFYGDIISGFGKLESPKKILNDDLSFFDYPKFLKKEGVLYQISFVALKKEGEIDKNFIKNILYKIKNIFIDGLQKVLKEPEATLASGIVLGDQSIPKDVENIFRISGLSHIVVLSGYNITIVAETIFKLFLPLTSFAPFVSIISIFLFTILAGGGASAVRASVMAGISIFAKRFGKTYSAGRAIFTAGFIMILFNPYILLYDPSFHLSFLATIAIIYLSPIIFQKINFVTEKFLFREILATTISAQIFVLPYLIFMNGKISSYSLFTNILVLPLVPLSMFLTFFTGLLSLFSKILALPLAFPLNIILSYFIKIAEWFSILPLAKIKTTKISIWILVFIYTIFIYLLYRFHKK